MKQKNFFNRIKEIKGMKNVYQSYPFYDHIIKKSSKVLQSKYGYRRLLQNTIERKETFTRTLGISSDIVQKEMYAFTDLGGNDLVLRPEGTAGAMRYLINDPSLMQNIEKEAQKMWYWGPMFRYERPQAGRLRQFYQLGIENIGGSVTRKG